jgi:hypothetical protein
MKLPDGSNSWKRLLEESATQTLPEGLTTIERELAPNRPPSVPAAAAVLHSEATLQTSNVVIPPTTTSAPQARTKLPSGSNSWTLRLAASMT